MFIKLTRTDGTPVWLNPDFIVRIEAWKKGSAVAAAGDGDFEVLEDPRAILALAGGTPAGGSRLSRPSTGETPVVPVEPAATGETPVVPVRKTRSRKKAVAESESEPVPAPEPAPEPAPVSEQPPASNLFPEPPDEVAMAAAILKKHRCRSRKRIQNTIKSLNPKMSMEAARALLEQMEARGFVIIDEQGHATFT